MLTVLGILDGEEYRLDLDHLTDSMCLSKFLSHQYKTTVMVFDGMEPLAEYRNGIQQGVDENGRHV